ncbi:MAG: 3-hydroxyacyl-ACP dehydratase FabZ [Synergistes sp.]|nr:3-hydroxyacyl-ACP dehydratase FabZ [Synergistes sp.]
MSVNINKIMELLPHRYPFLLVDRIENVIMEENYQEVTGYKNVSYNEPFFQGHFPDEPVMPGVLVLEAMGQVGAVLLNMTPEFQTGERKLLYITTVDKAKFRKPVRPGDQLRTTAKFKNRRGNMGKFAFVATVDGEVVAEAELGFVIAHDLTLENGEEK